MAKGKRAKVEELVETQVESDATLKNFTFEQFRIKWDRDGNNFSFDTNDGDGLHFYGWHRLTKIVKQDQVVHAIDLYVKRDGDSPIDLAVESITYQDDPRENIRSLNADICAAANRWFYQNFDGKVTALDQVLKQAKHPTIHVNRIATIDRIIMKLKEFRQVAIASGGTRICELVGDHRENPPLIISINVTNEAIALKGKAPSVEGAVAIGRAIRKEVENRSPVVQASPENVQAILTQLKAVPKHDKTQARKLRAILRKMGHKGGARAAE